jgi:hypothetical protein
MRSGTSGPQRRRQKLKWKSHELHHLANNNFCPRDTPWCLGFPDQERQAHKVVQEGLPASAEAFDLILALDHGWDEHFMQMRKAVHPVPA